MTRFAESSQRVVFKTASISPRERAEAYQALITGLETQVDAETFAANIEVYDLGPLLLLHTRNRAQIVRRTRERIRRDSRESILIHVSPGGGERGLAGDRSVVIEGGGVSVSDYTREFAYDLPAGELFTMIAARSAIEDRIGPVDDLHGLVLTPGRAAMLSDHVRWVGSRLAGTPVAQASELSQSILDLFAATVSPTAKVLERTRESIATAGCVRACRFIDANLTSAGLTPARIALAAGLSRSTLYRQFEPLGGVAAHVRRRRLEAARSALLDPNEARPLGVLAHDLGFSSQALFSRLFRDAFGYPPRELRGLGAANDAQAIGGVDLEQTNALFNAWVRRLG
jgi:AraC-like DNA-binding protein